MVEVAVTTPWRTAVLAVAVVGRLVRLAFAAATPVALVAAGGHRPLAVRGVPGSPAQTASPVVPISAAQAGAGVALRLQGAYPVVERVVEPNAQAGAVVPDTTEVAAVSSRTLRPARVVEEVEDRVSKEEATRSALVRLIVTRLIPLTQTTRAMQAWAAVLRPRPAMVAPEILGE